MDFVRVVKNSDDLEKFIDIPKGLKNRKVEHKGYVPLC